jgi:UDP-2-acetamido-3-amino-2,3-dideoxy-glucuronate N-acetyltransferase
MQFGIVGAGGYWGPNWVRVLSQIKALAAVCEADAARMQKVDERFGLDAAGVRLLADYDEMLAMDLDGVFVVTPPAWHADLAVAAIQAGKHVFVEKPLAASPAECDRIKLEAARAGRTVMVGHTFIYHPAVRRFKEALPMVGRLRTIYTIRANFGQYQSIGIVDDLLPHDLSIFNYLCSGFADSVRADVNPNQDVAFVTAVYGEVTCNALLSWGYPDKTRKLAAVGDRGILEWDLSNTHLLLHRKWAEAGEGGRFVHHDEGTQDVIVDDQSEPLMAEALHFIECIEQGAEPLTGIEDGTNVVKGLQACR